MKFTFSTAGRILFGPGSIHGAAALLTGIAPRALVFRGAPEALFLPFQEDLHRAGISTEVIEVSGEPDLPGLLAGIRTAADIRAGLLIGFGGGSAMDMAKATAALAENPGDPVDYFEVVGTGRQLQNSPLPCVAVPTTAGTGAEVTRNAVILVPDRKVKVSLRGNQLFPQFVVVDPELMVSLPPAVTAATGMDALTQLIEPFVCRNDNPIVDGFCREGICRSVRSLRRACEDGSRIDAREDLALAALLGGMALTNTGLGAVHGLAAPLGGRYTMPHGAICGRLLPLVVRANWEALRSRMPDSPAIQRYGELAILLAGNPQAAIEDGISWLENLVAGLAIPHLGEFGLKEEDIPELVRKAREASSMKLNPVELTAEELAAILHRAR